MFGQMNHYQHQAFGLTKTNMDKNGNITLSYETWKNGIKAPLIGMADIVNIDIFDKPGVAKLDFQPTLVGASSVATAVDPDTDSYRSCAIDTSGNAIIGSEEGDVYEYDINTRTFSNVANGSSTGDFHHAVEWKGYTIFASHSTGNRRIDLSAYSESLSGDNIEPAFESMPTNSLQSGLGDYRFSRGALCLGVDDVLYVGSGRYVGSLTEDTNFNPTSSATYTWNDQALDLPEEFEIDSIVNHNDFLLISAGNPRTREQYIFPWNRLSSSYEYPIPLNNGVAAQILASENLAFFLDGTRGQFKVTNRSNVSQITEFENITFPKRYDGLSQNPNAIALIDGTFLVGVSNDDAGTYPIGVYKIKGKAYTRQTLSEGYDGSTKNVRVHFITPFEYNNYIVSWENTTDDTFGVDEFGKDGYRATGYIAYMESPLYQVGMVLSDKSYQQIEIVLAKELTAGQGIRVSYRENLSDAWTTIGTYDYATYGAVSKINSNAGAINKTTLQLKVEMTTGANSTTSPELISVKLF